MKHLYREIVAEISQVAAKSACDKNAASRHHALMSKKPGSRTYGLRASEIHALIKTLRPVFRDLTDDQRLKLSLQLFRSRYEEEAAIGTALAAMSLDAVDFSRFDYLDQSMDLCCNWPMCDSFSLYVLQPLLKKQNGPLLDLLRQWTGSRNMWKRRASVVAFTRKAGASGRYAEQVLEFCETLLFDPEDLVQKGVGWALKDNLRGNRKRVVSYIKSCRRRGVSSVITLYAIRDLRGSERADVLAVKPG